MSMKIIRQRQKLYGDLNDGFKGKKKDILRSRLFRKSDSYKKFGPWTVEFSELSLDDMEDLDSATYSKLEKIVKDLEIHPYQGSYGQHPLWEFYDKENECVVWSAELTNEDRVTYLIFKQQNYILITNILGHFVIENKYAVRPNESFEMEVEDVFVISGLGTTATGKIKSGSISVCNKISLNGKSYKAKQLRIARKTVQTAKSGDNIGITLEGLDKDNINREDILTLEKEGPLFC